MRMPGADDPYAAIPGLGAPVVAALGRLPVGHRNPIRVPSGDSVPSPAMLYALFYAIIRRVLRLSGISSDADAEVL
ncbi:MAG TPA: hypothetical protein VGK11_07385, partial [Actinomycetota bacterium]